VLVGLCFSLDLSFELASACFIHAPMHVVDVPEVIESGCICRSQLQSSASYKAT